MSKGHENIEILSQEKPDLQSHEFSLSVLEGLSTQPKKLPSHLFYDDKGSHLFKKIMGLEEYYPTRSEAEILTTHGKSIARHLTNSSFNLVELGCGDGMKTMILMDHFIEQSAQFSFTPLDISKKAVDLLMANIQTKYATPAFEIKGLVADYFQGLNWIAKEKSDKNFVLFLGSNIGNFNRPMALRFLRHLWHSLNDGDLILIGFDLKKDLDLLYNAYNDSEGVTKEFNFNVLDRINQDLGGNFKRDNFQHQGLYNVQTGAMESYLISESQQDVYISSLDKSFSFEPWEAIHMEYSYKYTESDIESLSSSTGFEIVQNYTDSNSYFIDSLWKVKK